MKTKPKKFEIPQKPERSEGWRRMNVLRQRVNLHLVRPARLKTEAHRANVRPLRKPKKKLK